MFDSREIGRKLDGSEEQPFLKIGITLESFNKEGNLPVENDKLTNSAKGKDISVATSLRILVGML